MPGTYDQHVDHLSLSSESLLGSATVDMKTAQANTIFTTARACIITKIVVRDNTASLAGAGATSYSFTNFLQGVDLTGMTVTTGYRVLTAVTNTTYTKTAAGTAIQATVTTGATAAGTAVIDVFGYYV